MDRFFTAVEVRTERYLTKRKAQKAAAKAKKKTVKGEILDWVSAIVFAVVLIFFVNLWLFQFFVIPSPSMVSTINVGERVLVSKNTYGFEVYPEGPQILGNYRPERDDIITFYNPQYESKGPVFNVISTFLYMGTLSLVNIDRNEDGTMAEKLFVKRTVGLPGDRIRVREGNVFIKPAGSLDYISEEEFRAANNLSDAPHRTVDPTRYDGIKAWGRLAGYRDSGFNLNSAPSYLVDSYNSLNDRSYIGDMYEAEHQAFAMQSRIAPANLSLRSSLMEYENGIYVPSGYVLPMGDNRDNSTDGRYFGPVSADRVNGKVLSLVWPLSRIRSF